MEENSKITVVMYHYVREIQNSDFPGIKGLEVTQFINQINYLTNNYNFVTMEQLIDAVHNQAPLPPKALLLTFDDGYSDHYRYVLPVLLDKNLQGSFFPPAQAILEHKVLDVNKIHFILAAAPDIKALLREISAQLTLYRQEYNLPSDESLYRKLAIASSLDTAEVIFIKRLLQVELPLPARAQITNHLFGKFVQKTEAEFSCDLYMDLPQIKEMRELGMHIGSHGYAHKWLGTLPADEQNEEVQKGLDFLAQTGTDLQNWTMAYPYGNYNTSLVSIIEKAGCKLAFTTARGVASANSGNKLELPRIDTVNLPFG